MTEIRHCYCSLWQTAPETLREQGVPEGYCGMCSICGVAGHIRAHPHAPVSDAWCDDCYAGLCSAGAPLLARVVPALVVVVAITLVASVLWRQFG